MHSPVVTMDDSLDSKARNRANQRRSRQRQKDHIQSLEARLAEYEKHGAQASKAIQMAARRVADENRKLRELLAGLGLAPGDTDAYLAGAVSVQELTVARASEAMVPESRKPELTPAHGEMHVESRTAEIPSQESAIERPAQDIREVIKEAQTDEVQPVSHFHTKELVHKPSPQPQPDETDCEDAARIIAGMRGIGHPDDVRSELGCMPGGKCAIKNSRIFDLIDQ